MSGHGLAIVAAMGEIQLLVRRVQSRARVPEYQSALAAGLDLAACVPEPVTMSPGAIVVIPTGLSVAIPVGYEGQVRPRSGLATKHGVTVVNAPGTIDADYRGELKVALVNLGREAYVVEDGARIAQLVIGPVSRAVVRLVDDLPATERGAGGFGSTGGH